jgi:hypothetical protein
LPKIKGDACHLLFFACWWCSFSWIFSPGQIQSSSATPTGV